MKSKKPQGRPFVKPKDRLSAKVMIRLQPKEEADLEKYLKLRPSESKREILMQRVYAGQFKLCAGCDKMLSLPYVQMVDGTCWHMACREKHDSANIKYFVDEGSPA